MDVDRLRGAVPASAPHLLQETLLGDHRSAVRREGREEVELLRGELDLAPVDSHAPSPRVDLDVPDADDPRLRLAPAGAPSHRPDPGHELAHAERLHDVVVRAELEPDDAVDLLSLGGDHDDRDVRARAQLAAHRVAVDVRQAEVEEDDVGRGSLHDRLGARCDTVDLVPLAAQPFRERLRDGVLVLDDQDPHRVIVGAGAIGTDQSLPCLGVPLPRAGPPFRSGLLP